MPATITLKNLPDPVYERLKKAAKAHHRSLNSEVIASLERLMAPTPMDAEVRLDRARKLRAALEQNRFRPDEIAGAIRQGRS